MRTIRKVLLTFGLLLMAVSAMAQGTLKVTVIDAKTKEPLPFTPVVAMQNDKQVRGANTDMEGVATIKPLPVGKYDIKVSAMGYDPYVRAGVDVKATGFTVVEIELKSGMVTLEDVVIVEQKVPILEIGEASTSTRLSSDDIQHMPGTSVESIVAAVGGVGYNDGGTGTARGEGSMVSVQNGVRRHSSVAVPKEAIAEIQVILGGTPASIGEAIGGTQIITLKPPTPEFHGVIGLDSYLDYRFYNVLKFYLTGPVVKRNIVNDDGSTMERTLVGFRLSGNIIYENQPFYRVKDYRYQIVNDEKVRQFEENPLAYDPLTGTINYAAETDLHASDFHTITRLTKKDFGGDKSRVPDLQYYGIGMEGALNVSFSDYATLTITGEFSANHSPSVSISPLTMPLQGTFVTESMSYGLTVDFTQRFKDASEQPADADMPEAKSPTISNVMYNLTGMFSRSNAKQYNESYGSDINDIFKYGHVGTFHVDQIRTYDPVTAVENDGVTQLVAKQNAWAERVEYIEGDAVNNILSNYNRQLWTSESFSDIRDAGYLSARDYILQFKGLMNGDLPSSIYGMLPNVGVPGGSLTRNQTVYPFARSQTDYLFLQAKASADIKGHEIEIGFQYDQSWQSYYSLSAYSIWTLMRQNANRHILQMDMNNGKVVRGSDGQLYLQYPRLVDLANQSTFDKAFRTYLGAADTTYIDIDRYDPQTFVDAGGIKMFSSDELFNSGNSYVSYYGFDHTGEKYNSSKWTLDEFFNPTSNKNYQYLPSFSPIYLAGYIQDRFYFQDLIFNVGVRVDYFDGNQWVLKDPYLLYESYTVGDLRNGQAVYDGELYAGAGDDWVPYVDQIPEAGSTTRPSIKGYRDANGNWYNARGEQVDSPTQVKGNSGKPTPYRTADGQKTLQANTVSTKGVFERYKPQIIAMPRIAFSFPVGDNSQFKASYDIIARRPTESYWQASYLSYLYMSQISSITNPNLKPERITNYELGFQQAISSSAAVSASAYYKETRDLIQLVQYAGADPNNNYYSYDNKDFRTIKGVTLAYDLRQTKNIRINANYTLQYAEGTGLTSTTMTELIKEGYTTLKMLNPIADDRRHEFKANVDFRYGQGKKYNGPTINRVVVDKETGEKRNKEVKLLENFGVNFMAVAQSGRPYTRAFSNTQSTIVGSYNGARLPWSFFFNVVVDKSWILKVGKRDTYLNVALTINNLFDIRNVAAVYSVTGNPEDNGYLTDPETQQSINSQLDPQAYRDLYAITMRNGSWNYSTPRAFMLAVSYNF